MSSLRYPVTDMEKLGDRISRASVIATPETKWQAMGEEAAKYAAEQMAKLTAVLRSAVAMRAAQKAYFKCRNPDTLAASKKQERDFDALAEATLNPPQESLL
jgi:hypothetical protein